MVHPLLTLLFDLFLIGSAGAIATAMLLEYRASKGVAVGVARSAYRARQAKAALATTTRSRRSARLRAA